MKMPTSVILEESRSIGKVVTLEKGRGIEGPRFRVKTVSIRGYTKEADARAAFELESQQKRTQATI